MSQYETVYFVALLILFALQSPCILCGVHTLTIGSTTSGKSTGKTRDLIEEAKVGQNAIVLVDPHRRSMATWLLSHLTAYGLHRRILFDRLSDLKRVIGWKFLEPSTARNPIERRAENDGRVDAFTGLLTRRRGTAGLEKNPQTEEWTRLAVNLFIEQETEIPLSLLPFCFIPNHPYQHQFIDNCRDAEIARRFRDVASGKVRRGLYAPAERLIRGVMSPAFEVRCGKSLDIHSFLGNRRSPGILIVEGGSTGNVSHDAMRTMLGSVIQKVIQYVRNRRTPWPRIHLCIDEAANSDLIGTYECRALAETQKMGLDISILTQTLNFGSSFVQDMVLQNCMRHEWYYCGNASLAAAGAADLGNAEFKERLMQMSVGERSVKHHRSITHEKIEALDDLWCFPGLTEKKTDAALRQIQKKREYKTAKLVTAEWDDGPKSTPAQQSNLSVETSPLNRLDTDE